MSASAIRFYFALRSPYVWLAAERLVADGIEVDPVPVVGFAKGTVFSDPVANPPRFRYLIEDVSRLAARFGQTMAPPSNETDWRKAHNAAEYAKQQGRGMAYVHAATRARWTERFDLSDPAHVQEVASRAGLDPDATAAAMDDESLRADMEARYMPLIERDEVFGVPFFVLETATGRERFWGQDRLDMLLDAAKSAGISA